MLILTLKPRVVPPYRLRRIHSEIFLEGWKHGADAPERLQLVLCYYGVDIYYLTFTYRYMVARVVTHAMILGNVALRCNIQFGEAHVHMNT